MATIAKIANLSSSQLDSLEKSGPFHTRLALAVLNYITTGFRYEEKLWPANIGKAFNQAIAQIAEDSHPAKKLPRFLVSVSRYVWIKAVILVLAALCPVITIVSASFLSIGTVLTFTLVGLLAWAFTTFYIILTEDFSSQLKTDPQLIMSIALLIINMGGVIACGFKLYQGLGSIYNILCAAIVTICMTIFYIWLMIARLEDTVFRQKRIHQTAMELYNMRHAVTDQLVSDDTPILRANSTRYGGKQALSARNTYRRHILDHVIKPQ